jgi:hypothetical protein
MLLMVLLLPLLLTLQKILQEAGVVGQSPSLGVVPAAVHAAAAAAAADLALLLLAS